MDPHEYYEQEEERLVEELNNGLITQAEYDAEQRRLRREFREEAEYEADQARDRYLRGW